MGTFISQIRHCAQVLVPATVYSCLAAVFDIFEIGSLQEIELAKKGLCSLLALWDIILPLLTPITKHWDILFLCYILITVLGLSDFLCFFQLLLVEQSQEGDVVVDIEAGHHDAEEQETQGRGHDISLFFLHGGFVLLVIDSTILSCQFMC